MKNILVVCVGNICRSPMAEGLLKKISEERGLGLQVSSAGISALVSSAPASFAVEVMKRNCIDISLHRPRQLNLELLNEADLVLVMESQHQRDIGCLYPSAYGKVHRLGKWGEFDVVDPYRKPIEKFEETFFLIDQGLQQWLEKIWR